ncbi:lipocalin family protein [Gramella lutea]|uniref:Lipocalin family protein n=1 Tax=Christiangramia lutea TaxID=1607951 RepID=A0A9X1V138_9FLAO|nr:lipocalin family protein [Christiangramia lutea]MCH4822367.1 lipocalin family protein [Christiangramia lutea]
MSCSEEHKAYNLPENASSLLHGDSLKTWKIARGYNNDVRMNMGPCFMNYRQTYKLNGVVLDNNEENRDCGSSLKGQWKFKKNKKGEPYLKITSPDIPQLMNTDKDYKYFKILKLTRDTLKLSFKHAQYGNTKRTITDILVREDLDIGDRYFHH